MYFKLIVSGAVCFLSACAVDSSATYAYRPNTTNQQKQDAFLDCQVEATLKIPTSTQVATTPVFTTPIQTSCYGYSCTTTGGYVSGGNTYSYDENARLRDSYALQCMRKKGFSLQVVPVCSSDQSEGVYASISDMIKPFGSSSCIALLGENVGVPVP